MLEILARIKLCEFALENFYIIICEYTITQLYNYFITCFISQYKLCLES